jgi:predicted PurR-regulated permease PerM
MNHRKLQHKFFLFLLIAVTLGFGWIMLPFYAAIFWALVLAILCAPLQRRLLKILPRHRNLAVLASLLLVLVAVLLPLLLIGASLLQEGTIFYAKMRSGQIDFGIYFQQIMAALPSWMLKLLSRFGVDDMTTLKSTLSTAASHASQLIASKLLNLGQITAQFMISLGIMLYLLFFFLRDGVALAAKITRALPLENTDKRQLFAKFATVIRATIKGNLSVAATQGALGGLMFWILGIQGALLWAVLMAVMSLLPAIGAGLIWGPVALYYLATGALWQGISMILFGVFVIGLTDNILRPILVGKDTQMPDYVVLLSTLGGLAVFGLSGFVIGPVIAAMFIASWEIFANDAEADGK